MQIRIEKTFRVTGLSQFKYRELASTIRPGSTLILRPQPENRYDHNALGIYTQQNEAIGWIPKGDNPPLADAYRLAFGHRKDFKDIVKVISHNIDPNKIHDSLLAIKVVLDIDLAPLTPKGKEELLRTLSEAGFTLTNNPSAANIWRTSPYTEASRVDTPLEGASIGTAKSIIAVDRNISVDALQIDSSIKLSDIARLSLKNELKKDSTMTKIVDTNKTLATQAAFNEAGRIFLNQVTKVVAKQAPLMVKGYIDTPAGKLAIANATVLAVQHFRPADIRLNRLANAALAQAYQEVYQSFDIEKFIEGFLNNETIKAALSTVSENE